MKEGIERFWHSNGKLWYEIPYKNGNRHRLGKSWHSNGKLWYEIPFKNDIHCGAKIEFEY